MLANKKSLTLDELIAIADQAYPDGLVGMYHKEPKEDHGDGLAKFIAVELRETFDDKATRLDQLQQAFNSMCNAADELDKVIHAFDNAE